MRWIELDKEMPRIGMAVLLYGSCASLQVAYIYSDGFLYHGATNLRSETNVKLAYSHWIEIVPPYSVWLLDTIPEHVDEFKALGCITGASRIKDERLVGIYAVIGQTKMTKTLRDRIELEPRRYAPLTRTEYIEWMDIIGDVTLHTVANECETSVLKVLESIWRKQ